MQSINLYETIKTIIPYWSQSIINNLNIGNEYAMIINMIINGILEKYKNYVVLENICYSFVVFIIIILLKTMNLFNVFSLINFNKTNKYEIKQKICEPLQDIIKILSNKILELNKEAKISLYITNINNENIISHLKKMLIDKEDKIYIDIEITNDILKYVLYSNKSDNNTIISCINKLITDYDLNRIILYGNESNNTINYSDMMKYITFTLIYKYQIKNIIIKDTLEDTKKYTNNGPVNLNISNPNNTMNHTDCMSPFDNNKKQLFLLGNMVNYDINDEMQISVYRYDDIVKYNIKLNCSQTIQQFIDDCENYYLDNICFKNNVYCFGKIDNRPSTYDCNSADVDKNIFAISHYLIENYEKNHIICSKNELFKIITDEYTYIENEEIVIKIICAHSESRTTGFLNIKFILSSQKEILPFIEKCNKLYDEYVAKCSNFLYIYTLTHITNGCNVHFDESLICDNTNIYLYESFDNIYTDHNEKLINDIKKLNDEGYYKKHGLKRKLSYLFYGIPGSGKSTSVICMAKESGRHIVNVPFSLIDTTQKLKLIMNIKEINGKKITNDKIIIVFDELDKELNLNDKNETKNIGNTIIINSSTDQNNNIESNKINLGSLLTALDGIENYNKMIFIAIANDTGKLDKALFRDMRLTPLQFSYMSNYNAIKLIESYFEKLNGDQKELIKDKQLNSANLTNLCMTCNNVNELLNKINQPTNA